MKKASLFLSLSIFSITAFSQNFPGISSGNYSGVNGAFTNPANIANNKYSWNLNLLSLHAGVVNNNASFSLKDIGSSFDDADSVFFGNSAKSTSGAISTDIHGPSLMISGKKNSFAFTTRLRVMANIVDMDGQFIQSISNDLSSSTTFPFALKSNQNQKFILNGWTDWGVTYGRVLSDKGNHLFKAGITVKYLAGATNSYINIDNLKGTLDDDITGDVYLTNATGRVAMGVGGIDLSDDDFDVADALKFKGHGIGADIGFVYEYKKGNSYKFKAGIALLDIGSIKYKTNTNQSGDYNINVPNGAHWYPSDLDDKSVSEINDYLDGSPYFTNNPGIKSEYKASLPTTLRLDLDYAVTKKLFIALGSNINLIQEKSIYNSFYYSTVALTPRFEGRRLGIYLPISYNTLSKFNAGVSLKLGPLFIGSGSVLTALMDKSKQADFHFGFQFGGLRNKKN
ncbi:MAG: DUF5723 family protein [Chitinophagaceae bacterium]